MTMKEMIKENNKLREQMTPDNKDYYEDIVVYFRSSEADRTQSEQLLLKLAHQVLEAQQKGINARQLLGVDAVEYSRTQVATLAKRKTITGIQYYIMIPWVALTMFFFMEALVGFTAQWLGGTMTTFNQISLFSLIIIALGSILLIEAVTKLLNRGNEEETNAKPRINLKTIGIFVAVMVVILMIGYLFGNLLPVFTVQPWASLLIAFIGLVGSIILFKRGK
ncbi:DUF1129 family protein [Paenibacillus sp. FA6]|uniref:DUF1129 family protein n=1 Tax=Paenibacillus sp. FA6 TaxID=3413029 RepID=UPI003F656385